MTDVEAIFEFLAGQMSSPDTHWSLGTFGAIAEFMRDPDEPVVLICGNNILSAVTGRGGIRIEPPADLRPVASEDAVNKGWNHRVALCLREDRCAMNRRTVLTELGPDGGALRDQDRSGILFDLGLGCIQVDVHVRVADSGSIARLRMHVGRPLFEPGNPAMSVILAASPPRVFVSHVGRVEVYQSIPAGAGTSPEGPHTHVLPKLLGQGRTHAATETIPEGWVPCAHLYPPHPARNALGRPQPFDPARHDAFQNILHRFGDPDLVALKRRVVEAVTAGKEPSVVSIANDRFARASIRVALRQLKASSRYAPSLPAWMAAHEGAGPNGTEQENPEA